MSQMTNPFEGIRAALFDLDGTLVETNIDFGLMKREMLALGEKHGIPACEMQGLDILSIVDFIVARLMESSRVDEAEQAKQEAFEKLEQIGAGSLPGCQARQRRCGSARCASRGADQDRHNHQELYLRGSAVHRWKRYLLGCPSHEGRRFERQAPS